MDCKQPKLFSILGVGHPLLDIIAKVPEEFLQKYHLKSNDSIMARLEHENLCKDVMENFQFDQVPGGSIQNAIRVAQWFFDQHQVCSMLGCIGDDDLGRMLMQQIRKEQIKDVYMVDSKSPTGTCVCLINHNDRSLVSFLGASRSLTINHIEKSKFYWDQAKIVYISGFILVSNPREILHLAKMAKESFANKLFAFNLSATFVARDHCGLLLQIWQSVDLVFGNSDEAIAFADALGWKEEDLAVIGEKLVNLSPNREDRNGQKKRMVVITQGGDDIVVAYNKQHKLIDEKAEILRHPVPQLPQDQINDTNGTGDAFVGGFLAYRMAEKPLEECLNAGIYAAQQVIQGCGCTLTTENDMKLSSI